MFVIAYDNDDEDDDDNNNTIERFTTAKIHSSINWRIKKIQSNPIQSNPIQFNSINTKPN
jgi:hypothetical protein